jgi:Tol biopolymer transport system component/DNA-binding winged helix-turn-helix (wHTH) protein
MSRVISGSYDFGTFRLDLERRVLTRGLDVVPVAPKTFELLVLLVRSPGRAFSKEELMNALWPDTFVEEANLSFQISVLRKALGPAAARWIQTVPKHGYRFDADVRAAVTPDQGTTATGSADAERAAVPPKRGLRGRRLAGATLAAALLVGAALLTVGRDWWGNGLTTSAGIAVPLTAYPGIEQMPSLSADGSRVAFSWNGPAQDNYDIYVKLAGPGEAVALTKNPAADVSPVWSPDGRFIAFLRMTSSLGPSDLIVIPALGGAERTIATLFPPGIPHRVRPVGNLSWTPDGRWLAFGGATSPNDSPGIWLISADGSERRRLTETAGGLREMTPVVSPDGRYVAFLRGRTLGRDAIFLLPLTSDWRPAGAPRQLVADDNAVLGLAWTPDGRDLVFSSASHNGLSRAARIPVSQSGSPEPELLPFGEQATGISVSRTGRLVYARHFRDTALYELALSGAPATPIALAGFASTFDEHTPAYSPDGKRLAFASTRSGSEEIWIANRDGSNPLQMTSMGGPQCSNPQWSPDGRTILFNSRRSGRADLYLLQPDTDKVTQLTSDPSEEAEARWSRDGRWIYFGSDRTGRVEVWRMSAAGGAATPITRQGGIYAIESADGFLYYAKQPTTPTSIWRVPVEGGAETKVVDGLSYSLNFAVGERGLYFAAVNDASDKVSIDFFDFRTRQRSTLGRLDKPFWYGMAMSPDERSLVFSVVESAGSNLMVVDRFR